MKPVATFEISGEIEDFTRLDNLYRTMKREGEKLLKNYIIKVTAEYEETKE